MNPHDISVNDYNYDLPESKIPKYPLDARDQSKLLVYQNLEIKEDSFSNVAEHLPKETMLVFNDSKVIPVRLFFETAESKLVEVFCLEPYQELGSNKAIWKCFVGRVKKWKQKALSQTKGNHIIEVELVSKENDYSLVQFTWSHSVGSIYDLFQIFGAIPIPPYLKRESEAIDTERYQNVFANHKGSVAAPTAGLHFTKPLLSQLKENGICQDFVTLHVGAGTFKPVSSDTIEGHQMHLERMQVTKSLIEKLLDRISNKKGTTAVGTTTLRTLESLYWLGNKIAKQANLQEDQMNVTQWEPYDEGEPVSTMASLQATLGWLEQQEIDTLQFTTELLILPSYQFRMIDCLITNFHQPKSTLLLLVAAAIGHKWKEIYRYALENNFRFLSYGDSSLLYLTKAK